MAREIQYSSSRQYGDCRPNGRLYFGGEFPWKVGAECAVTPDTPEFTVLAYDDNVYTSDTEIECGVVVNPTEVAGDYGLRLTLANGASENIVINKTDITISGDADFDLIFQYGGAVEVAGAGSTIVNGIYSFVNYINHRPCYYNASNNLWIYWEPEAETDGPGYWSLYHDLSAIFYQSASASMQPFDSTTWVVGNTGVEPVPTFTPLNIISDSLGGSVITVTPGTSIKVLALYEPATFPYDTAVSATVSVPEDCTTQIAFTTISSTPGPEPLDYNLWVRDFEVMSDYQQVSCGFHYETPVAYEYYYLDVDVRNDSSASISLPKSGIILDAGAEPGFVLKYVAGGIIEISGAGSSIVNGIYYCGYASDGKCYYYNNDNGLNIDWVVQEGGYWAILSYGPYNEYYVSTDDTVEPFEATNWTISPRVTNLGINPPPTLSGTPANTHESAEANLIIAASAKAIISVEWLPDEAPDHEVPFTLTIPKGEDTCQVSVLIIAPDTPTECAYALPSNFAPSEDGLLQGFALDDYNDSTWSTVVNSASSGPAYIVRNGAMSDDGRYILVGGVTPDFVTSKWCVIERTDEGFTTHLINTTGIQGLSPIQNFNANEIVHKITRDGRMVFKVTLSGGGIGSACWNNGFSNPPLVSTYEHYYKWITDAGFTLGWNASNVPVRVDLETNIEEFITGASYQPQVCGDYCMKRVLAWSSTDPDERMALFERDSGGTWNELPGILVAHNVDPEVDYPTAVDMSGDGNLVVGYDSYGYDKALYWDLTQSPVDGYYQATVLPGPINTGSYGTGGSPETVASDGSVIAGYTSYGYPCFWVAAENFAVCHILEDFMKVQTVGPQEVQLASESITDAYTVYGNFHVGAEGRQFLIIGEKNFQYGPGAFADSIMYCSPLITLGQAVSNTFALDFNSNIIFDTPPQGGGQYYSANQGGGLYGWALWVMTSDTTRELVHFEQDPMTGQYDLSSYLTLPVVTDIPGTVKRFIITVLTVDSSGLDLTSELVTNLTVESGTGTVAGYTNMTSALAEHGYTWFASRLLSNNDLVAYVDDGQYIEIDTADYNVTVSMSNALPALPI
jgi:hypothetical protein